jgi:isoamyl acetate esterase
MKKLLIIWVLVVSILITACMANKPKKIIFFGDSITQLGVEPGGYIDLMYKNFVAQNSIDNYELIGSGISGNKVYDLYLRLEEDVLSKKPDVAVIWIGVNDVWHKASMGTGTDADKFYKFYAALIEKMQADKIKVIVATPAVIGEKYDNTNAQDEDLNLYADIIRKLAAQYKCGLCDLRKLFMDYELKNNKENAEAGILTADRVHLNAAGNALVAEAMMNEIKSVLQNERQQ